MAEMVELDVEINTHQAQLPAGEDTAEEEDDEDLSACPLTLRRTPGQPTHHV